MEKEMKKAYSEVIAVLKLIDDESKLEKLPMEFIELIRGKADPNYMPEFSKEIPIEEQGLKNETYSILAWIASKYWSQEMVNNEEESKNNIKLEEKIIEKVEDVEKEEVFVHNDIEPECLELKNETSNNLPITFKDLRWYEKIKIRIIAIFNKLFKKKTYSGTEVIE